MSRQRFFFLAATVFHFTVILSVCIQSSIDGYLSFYKKEPNRAASTLYKSTEAINHVIGVRWYSAIAGIDAGYGFFAPNVASGYILEFMSYNKNGELLHQWQQPNFAHRESFVRYSSLLDSFQDKLLSGKSDHHSLRQRHLNAIIKSMASSTFDDDKQIDEVHATLYLYHFPSLKAYRSGDTHPQLFPIEKFNIAR